jgi:hypothetical protein
MRTRMSLKTVALAAAASLSLAAAAQARPEYSTGNIVATDWGAYTMDLKDNKGRVGTWKVSRNASVKFTDGANSYRNPKLTDLRPPMYIHFMFDNEVIQEIDVRELGFTPGQGSGSGQKEQGVGRTVNGTITAFDADRGQVEVQHDGIRETFLVKSRQLFDGVQAGRGVTLKTEWVGDHEVVYDLSVAKGSGNTQGQRKK